MYANIEVRGKVFCQDTDCSGLTKMLTAIKNSHGLIRVEISDDASEPERICMLQATYADSIEYLGVLFCSPEEQFLLQEEYLPLLTENVTRT